MSKTLTIELPDRTARDLAKGAADMGLTVSQLIETIADQFLTDQGPTFDLSEDQVLQIKRNMEDPRPSIPHDEVIAGARRILAGEE